MPDLAGANKRPQPPASWSSFRPPGAKSACTPPLLVFFSKTKNIFGFYSSIRIHARKNGGKRPPPYCATGPATSRHLSHRSALTVSARGVVPPWPKSGCTRHTLVFFSKTKNIFGSYYFMRTHARKNGGKRPPLYRATGPATSRHLSHSPALTVCARCGLPTWGKIGLHAAPPGVFF